MKVSGAGPLRLSGEISDPISGTHRFRTQREGEDPYHIPEALSPTLLPGSRELLPRPL